MIAVRNVLRQKISMSVLMVTIIDSLLRIRNSGECVEFLSIGTLILTKALTKPIWILDASQNCFLREDYIDRDSWSKSFSATFASKVIAIRNKLLKKISPQLLDGKTHDCKHVQVVSFFDGKASLASFTFRWLQYKVFFWRKYRSPFWLYHGEP